MRAMIVLGCAGLMAACGGGGSDAQPSLPKPQITVETAGGYQLRQSFGVDAAIVVAAKDGRFWSMGSGVNTGMIMGNVASAGATRYTFNDNPVRLTGTAVVNKDQFKAYLSDAKFIAPASPNVVTYPISALVGTYSGNISARGYGEGLSVSVGADGSFMLLSNQWCTMSGRVTHKEGDVHVEFVGTYPNNWCHHANKTFTGTMLLDKSAKTLYVMGEATDRSTGLWFVGSTR